MWKAEEDFPRGGAKVHKAFTKDDNENTSENGNKIQVKYLILFVIGVLLANYSILLHILNPRRCGESYF